MKDADREALMKQAVKVFNRTEYASDDDGADGCGYVLMLADQDGLSVTSQLKRAVAASRSSSASTWIRRRWRPASIGRSAW